MHSVQIFDRLLNIFISFVFLCISNWFVCCCTTLAVHSESQSHARNVTSLQSELERERLTHQETMLSLSAGMCITHSLGLQYENVEWHTVEPALVLN